MQVQYIVWNGCDAYEMSAKDETIYKGAFSYDSFPVFEIEKEDVPLDKDGELNFDGVYLNIDFRVFKAI